MLPAGLALLLAATLAGRWLRWSVIEPEHLEALCRAASPPAACAGRDLLLYLTFPPRYGLVAVVAAVLAWFLRGRPAMLAAAVALATGGLGLTLYDTGWAVSGVLIALVRLPGLERVAPAPGFRPQRPAPGPGQ